MCDPFSGCPVMSGRGLVVETCNAIHRGQERRGDHLTVALRVGWEAIKPVSGSSPAPHYAASCLSVRDAALSPTLAAPQPHAVPDGVPLRASAPHPPAAPPPRDRPYMPDPTSQSLRSPACGICAPTGCPSTTSARPANTQAIDL